MAFKNLALLIGFFWLKFLVDFSRCLYTNNVVSKNNFVCKECCGTVVITNMVKNKKEITPSSSSDRTFVIKESLGVSISRKENKA